MAKSPLPPALPMDYDPDVLRVAQRHADQVRAIAELETALHEWKERATVAEKLNQSLDQHIKNIEHDFSREREEARAQYRFDIDRLTADRDHWRDQYVRVEENLSKIGQHVLDVMNQSHARRADTDVRTKAALEKVAGEILHQTGNGQSN